KRDHAGGEGGADLGVHVLERRGDLRELGEPAQIRNAVAKLAGADRGERLGVEEARPEAGVVDDEIELRPVVRDLRQIAWGSLLGYVRRCRRQSLVDADVEEARMLFQLLAVVADELVSGISDLLVVEPPLLELALGIGVELRGIGDVVALPRIRMEPVDLLLHESEAVLAGKDLAVREKPRRA